MQEELNAGGRLTLVLTQQGPIALLNPVKIIAKKQPGRMAEAHAPGLPAPTGTRDRNSTDS